MRCARVCVSPVSSALLGGVTQRKRRELSGRSTYTPSRNNMWKWMFRFSALPNRWIKVTAPAWAVLREKPAFLIRNVAMQR